MAKEGYEGATIQSIARQAKLSPGLLHYHFHSKLEIMLELIQLLSDRVQSRFEALAKKSKTEAESDAELRAFIKAHLMPGEDAYPNAVACWIVIGSEALRQQEVREAYQKICHKHISLLETIVRACLESRQRESRQARSIALGIFAAIEGAYRLVLAAPSLIESGFAAPTVEAMALGALAAQPEA